MIDVGPSGSNSGLLFEELLFSSKSTVLGFRTIVAENSLRNI